MQTETKRRLSPRLRAALLTAALAAAALAAAALLLLAVNRFRVEVTPRGGAALTVEYGTRYEDAGADAALVGRLFFRRGRPLTVETAGAVDTGSTGDYALEYRARALGLEGTARRDVHVRDTTPPTITLVTGEDSHTRPGDSYAEEGYSAWDARDGDLTARVERFEGTEEIRYSVTDSAGNTAACVRPIVYADRAPVITLSGESSMVINAAPDFTDPGWSAMDDFDGDLTGRVVTGGDFSPYRAGVWQRSYTVTDSAGNSSTVLRDIQVRAVTRPETVQPEGRVIYLTFDDGPSSHTPRLLDVLDAYGVKATFFVKETDYVNYIGDICARGHSIGVHTASHDYNAIYASEEAFFADYCRMRDIIRRESGVETTLLRFPGGSSNTSSWFNPGIMTRLTAAVTDMGLQYFDWNVTAADSAPDAGYDTVVANVCGGVEQHDASVVLQHDTRGFSVDAVEEIICRALERGYRFLPLDATSPTAHHGVNN